MAHPDNKAKPGTLLHEVLEIMLGAHWPATYLVMPPDAIAKEGPDYVQSVAESMGLQLRPGAPLPRGNGFVMFTPPNQFSGRPT